MRRHIRKVELSAYVDGELPPERAARVADHLAVCSHCLAEARALAETVALLQGSRRPVAPPTLAVGIARRLEEERAILWPSAAASGGRRGTDRRGRVVWIGAWRGQGQAAPASWTAQTRSERQRPSLRRWAVGAVLATAVALGWAWTAGPWREDPQSQPVVAGQENLDFFFRDHSRYVDARQVFLGGDVQLAAGWP